MSRINFNYYNFSSWEFEGTYLLFMEILQVFLFLQFHNFTILKFYNWWINLTLTNWNWLRSFCCNSVGCKCCCKIVGLFTPYVWIIIANNVWLPFQPPGISIWWLQFFVDAYEDAESNGVNDRSWFFELRGALPIYCFELLLWIYKLK